MVYSEVVPSTSNNSDVGRAFRLRVLAVPLLGLLGDDRWRWKLGPHRERGAPRVTNLT